jgi:integral membrane protein
VDRPFLKKLRCLGFIEGTSTLLLFGVAMPLKYIGGNEIGVKIIGPLHGILFIGLVVMAAIAIERIPLGAKLGMATIIAAVVPFGPFVMDRWLKKLDA